METATLANHSEDRTCVLAKASGERRWPQNSSRRTLWFHHWYSPGHQTQGASYERRQWTNGGPIFGAFGNITTNQKTKSYSRSFHRHRPYIGLMLLSTDSLLWSMSPLRSSWAYITVIYSRYLCVFINNYAGLVFLLLVSYNSLLCYSIFSVI